VKVFVDCQVDQIDGFKTNIQVRNYIPFKIARCGAIVGVKRISNIDTRSHLIHCIGRFTTFRVFGSIEDLQYMFTG